MRGDNGSGQHSKKCNFLSGRSITEVLPEIVSRKRAPELTGGFISPKTMANLDSLNRGPAKKIMIGKQVGYMKNDFIDFFLRQIK